mmetsp:Transcript_19581/g.25344  ORF Transcript_19581/g.25344 Transcript_19581/m.25344 type:complete len:120 (+) Transcript_19581:59-418(+)
MAANSTGIAMPAHQSSSHQSTNPMSAEEMLDDALRTNEETAEIGNTTLSQIQRQGEQLQGTQRTVQATDNTVREARIVLKGMSWRIFKEKLWLWLIILFLLAIDTALAYRLATNKGSIS